MEENNQIEKQRIISYLKANKVISQRFDDKSKNFIHIMGNASFEKNEIVFKSNDLYIYGNNTKRITTSSYVEIFDKKHKIKLSGKKLEYIKDKSYIYITNESQIIFFDKKNEQNIQSTIYAQEIERFLERKETVLKGNLIVKSNNIEIKGEYATYYDESEKMIIYGNPSFKRNNINMKVGEIIFYPKEQKIILSNGLNLN